MKKLLEWILLIVFTGTIGVLSGWATYQMVKTDHSQQINDCYYLIREMKEIVQGP